MMAELHRTTGCSDLLDILEALCMDEAGCVGVGEFIDEQELLSTLDARLDVELHQRAAAIGDWLARQNVEPFEKCCRLGPAMGLNHAYEHSDARSGSDCA